MKRTLCLIICLIVISLLISGCQGYREITYNWDNSVAEYLAKHYPNKNISYERAEYDDDAQTYHCTINDERGIEFTLKCRFTYLRNFFTISRVESVSSNLKDALDKWASKKYGEYNITDKTVDDIVTHIIESINAADTIYDEYHIYTEPCLSFILWDAEHLYTLDVSTTDDYLIRMKLKEVFEPSSQRNIP